MSKLYLLCGIPGSGKSTWVRAHAKETNGLVVSRDAIRFSFLDEGDDYFAWEDQVWRIFIERINAYLAAGRDVYADATHLNPKSRTKLLSKLNLKDVDIYPVVFMVPLMTCIERNMNRTDRARVPNDVIKRMNESFIVPSDNEAFVYKQILFVNEKGEMINEMLN